MALPYQQHQKIRQTIQQKSQSSNNTGLDILKDKPFWIWDKAEHLKLAKETNQNCCFNHIVKCPTDKTGRERPLWDYQKIIFDTLFSVDNNFKDKHLYLLKSTGLGASEMMLRIIAWLCTKDNTYRNSQMVIVTGPNLDLSVKLMKRLKAIFEAKLGIYFQDKETVLNLNGCVIESFPSNHLDSFRSLTNPAFILLDELDFIRASEQEDVRHISERYIGKNDAFIVMVSTPNCPGSLMENIMKEPEQTCIYKRLFMDWTYGINKIYSTSDIEKGKMSPSWEREFCCKFSGRIGNLLSQKVIDYAVSLGEQFNTDKEPINPLAIHSLGVDPAFSSSACGMVLTELIPQRNIIRVLYADQFGGDGTHPDPAMLVEKIFDFHRQYWNLVIPIDSVNRGFIPSCKIAFNESINYARVEDVSPANNKIIPVNFSTENKSMIAHLATLFQDHKVAIDPRFDKLIISLRTAQCNEYSLLKEQTSYNDIFDALRLSLRMYKIT